MANPPDPNACGGAKYHHWGDLFVLGDLDLATTQYRDRPTNLETEMSGIGKIKARLGSIAPAKIDATTKSMQRLLREDVPRLIALAEVAEAIYKSGRFDNWENGVKGLAEALDKLEVL